MARERWTIGDVYYQAEIYRHGRGLDYGLLPCRTKVEAENDLQSSLSDMSERERKQSEIESYVAKYRVVEIDDSGEIGTAVTTAIA